MSLVQFVEGTSAPLIDLSRPDRSGVLLRGVFLSPREWEIAIEISRGCTNNQISRNLGMSIATGKMYVSRVLTKIANRYPELKHKERRVILGIWVHHAVNCGRRDW